MISDNPKVMFKNLKKFESNGIAGFHFDIMDGIFVPRFGLYPELLRAIRSETKLPIEVHIMTANYLPYIDLLVEAGATRLVVHFEVLKNPVFELKSIRNTGVDVGVALNPRSSVHSLLEFVDELDLILLMAINPGVPKHPFLPETFKKLIELRSLLDYKNLNTKIGIDGGVTFENVEKLFKFGANVLICGSGTVFKQGESVDSNLTKLMKLFNNSIN